MGRFEGPSLPPIQKPREQKENTKPNAMRKFFDTLFSSNNKRTQDIRKEFNKPIDQSIEARQKLMKEIHQPNGFQRFLQKIKSPFVRKTVDRASDYYVAQDKSNNCGPTSCAIAAAKLLGLNPQQLRDKFTRSKPGAMGWNTPAELLRPMGLNVQQTGKLSSVDLTSILANGDKVVITSTNSKSELTQGGHIVALTGVAGDKVINSDPNIRNIQKGLGTIDPDVLTKKGGAKQYWVVSKSGGGNMSINA